MCVSESVCVEICMNECKVCMHPADLDIIIFMCHTHACIDIHIPSYTLKQVQKERERREERERERELREQRRESRYVRDRILGHYMMHA